MVFAIWFIVIQIISDNYEGALMKSVTLHCPVETIGSQESVQRKAWYKGRDPAELKMVGNMIMHDLAVKNEQTYGDRSDDMGFTSIDGDLIIRNLRFDDAGFYTCHFTGFAPKIIELSVKGIFFFFLFKVKLPWIFHICDQYTPQCSIKLNIQPDIEMIMFFITKSSECIISGLIPYKCFLRR